jgi:hypothetical protein
MKKIVFDRRNDGALALAIVASSMAAANFAGTWRWTRPRAGVGPAHARR